MDQLSFPIYNTDCPRAGAGAAQRGGSQECVTYAGVEVLVVAGARRSLGDHVLGRHAPGSTHTGRVDDVAGASAAAGVFWLVGPAVHALADDASVDVRAVVLADVSGTCDGISLSIYAGV